MVKKGEIPWKHRPKRKAGRWRASSDTAKPEARKLRSKQTKKNGKIQIPLIPPSPCFSDKQDLSYKINWQFINSWNEKTNNFRLQKGTPSRTSSSRPIPAKVSGRIIFGSSMPYHLLPTCCCQSILRASSVCALLWSISVPCGQGLADA